MALTTKRRVFIEEYLQCWNGAEAARRAGYAHPRQEASRLLSNDDILARVTARIDELTMTADEALIRLADQARASIEDFIEFDSYGSRVWRVDLQGAQESGKLHVLKKLSYDAEGHPRLELHDSQRALELILKIHGAFKERFEHSGPGGGPLETVITVEYVESPIAAAQAAPEPGED